jgi:hypothetical protein
MQSGRWVPSQPAAQKGPSGGRVIPAFGITDISGRERHCRIESAMHLTILGSGLTATFAVLRGDERLSIDLRGDNDDVLRDSGLVSNQEIRTAGTGCQSIRVAAIVAKATVALCRSAA